MLKLTFDVTTGNLVPWQGSASTLPDFRQGRTPVQIRFVTPNPDAIVGSINTSFSQYEVADLTGYLGVRMGIWSNSTGTLDDSSAFLIALIPHTDFTYDTSDLADPFFSGTFNTYTTEMANAIGLNKSLSAYFAVGFVNADLTLQPVYDQRGSANCTVYSATDDASGALPTSAIPGYRAITLPVYFKSADGLRTYVLDENAGHDGMVFSQFSP